MVVVNDYVRNKVNNIQGKLRAIVDDQAVLQEFNYDDNKEIVLTKYYWLCQYKNLEFLFRKDEDVEEET